MIYLVMFRQSLCLLLSRHMLALLLLGGLVLGVHLGTSGHLGVGKTGLCLIL